MCKSTLRTRSASQARLLDIDPNAPGVVGGGGGGVNAEAGLPGPLIGSPDFAPQHTFIAQASPSDNGFIANALAFHTSSGMNPHTIQSIQQILDLLDTPAETGAGIINRIRIVTHVFFDPSGHGDPTNMMRPFLTGGVRPTLKRHFDGFAGTRIDALKAMMTFEVTNFANTTHYVNADTGAAIMGFLRPAQNAIVNLIPTDGLGELSADFNDFFRLSGSLWALTRGVIANAGLKTNLEQAYGILLSDVMPRLSPTLTQPQAATLRDAVAALGNSQTLHSQTPFAPVDYNQNLTAALDVVGNNNYFEKLARVRQRFTRNSKIDIRGCQVGRDPEFLHAVRKFFGTNANVRPAVSGPMWFQFFNAIGTVTARQNSHVAGLHNSGNGPYTGPQLQAHFDTWATGFGITAAHVTFWQTTLNSNALAFCAFLWRATLPATTIPVTRIQALAAADFNAVMNFIARTFLVPNADIPNAAAMTSAGPLAVDAAVTSAQLAAPVADAATAPQLATLFNQLKALYERVDNRIGTGSPPSAAQRVIPSAQPAALTPVIMRAFQAALAAFIDTHANSRLRPVKRLMAAARANTLDAPARMRYFLGLGLPFLAFSTAPNAPANHNFLVAFEDMTGTDHRENDAVKYWIRAHWQGIIPAGLGAGATFSASMHAPWLAEFHQPGAGLTLPPFVISPTDQFHAKIVTLLPQDP
jgi:hypothetical protein